MAIIFLIIAPFITIALSIFVKKNRAVLETITLVSSVIEIIAGIYIAISVANTNSYLLSPFFEIHALEALILFISVIIGFIANLYSIGYLRQKIQQEAIGFRRVKQYYILLRLFLMTMFVAITTSNPIIMWIAIETTTLSTAFLISFYNRDFDIEASWKYLILNTVGILFALLGTLLFLTPGFPVINAFVGWKEVFTASLQSNPLILKIAFIFILIGYGTKMGIVPMHTWKPDAYNRAPSPIVALLSGILLNIAFLAILRFKIITDSVIGTDFTQNLFIAFGILSIILSSLIIYTQINYKRLMAYSSIEHAGIIMLGFGFGGIGIYAGLLQMMYHAFAKALLFLLSGNLFFTYNSDQIKNVKGVLKILPTTGILLILGFLAITGVPPFGTFLTELYIAMAGLKNYPIIVMIALIAFILVFIGFFRSVFSMAYGEPPINMIKEKTNFWTILPLIGLAILLIVLSVYLPHFLQTLIQNASAFIIKPYEQI